MIMMIIRIQKKHKVGITSVSLLHNYGPEENLLLQVRHFSFKGMIFHSPDKLRFGFSKPLMLYNLIVVLALFIGSGASDSSKSVTA